MMYSALQVTWSHVLLGGFWMIVVLCVSDPARIISAGHNCSVQRYVLHLTVCVPRGWLYLEIAVWTPWSASL